MKSPQLTPQTARVLSALMGARGGELAGADIAAQTGLASGSLYPILIRLESAGWLDSRWEEGDPQTLGRPRRRYYRVTAVGQAAAREKAASIAQLFGGLAWT